VSADAAASRSATWNALRTATACVVCLVVAEWWRLKHANLAVWTTYLVMVQFPFSSFQKGVERIIGRVLGIFAGLVITTWLNGAPLAGLILIGVVLTGCAYLYFAGRLAYTFLNAGLYAVALFEIGTADPSSAVAEGKELLLAVVLGVMLANLTTWLSGAEGTLHIETGQAPLWPVRLDWISRGVMLAVTAGLTLFACHRIGLPAEKAAISVLILTVTPTLQELLHKGELRLAGAITAIFWSVVTFTLLFLQPHFVLLAVLLFLGQFTAAYWTRIGGTNSYAGLQMGVVLPMLVVAPPGEFGSIAAGVQRIEGILVALVASVLVGGVWPRVAAPRTVAQ
jgi:uncharacterized membrane protein YccC